MKQKVSIFGVLAVAVLAMSLALAMPATAGAANSLDDVWCASESSCIGVGGSDESGDYNAHSMLWNGTSWSDQEVPVPERADTSRLTGVSCTSISSCVAVGSHKDDENVKVILVMRWDGSSWDEEFAVPPEEAIASELNEVACTSSSACVAVGSYLDDEEVKKALAMHWDGSKWSLTTHPQPSETLNELVGVSCVAANDCVAVGSFVNSSEVTKTLASVWNGTSWSVVSTPEPSGAELSQLQDISCRPSEACTAVGNYSTSGGEEKTLALRRNTSKEWSIQSTPNPSGALSRSLTAVSCPSSSECAAVGVYEQGSKEMPMAIRWNGTSWSTQTIDMEALGADATRLASISCPSTTACATTGSIAFGSSAAPRALALKYNGTTWLLTEEGSYERSWISFDSMTRPKTLHSVSCPSTQKCVAVGGLVDDTGTRRTQVATLSGGSWTAAAGPVPSGATESGLYGVSCTSFSSCWAVGAFTDSSGVQRQLVVKWDGTSWSIHSSPTPGDADASILTSIDCSSASACLAVGSYAREEEGEEESAQIPFAMTFNGSSWSHTEVPLPPEAPASLLAGVSCATNTSCVAVGAQQDAFGHEVGLAAKWNGSAWSLSSMPSLEGEAPHLLTGVSCATTSYCIAVGSSDGLDVENKPLGMTWNGTSWSQVELPSVGSSELTGVSCLSTSDCTATGRSNSSSTQLPYILHWNGTAWTEETDVDYSSATAGFLLTSVSCLSSDECHATGSASHRDLAATNIAFSKDGGEWLATDTTTRGATLRGVSCLSAERCYAIGDSAQPTDSSAAAWVLEEERWSASSPAPAEEAYLTDVSCLSDDDCWAVGREGKWPFEPLVQRWTGGWSSAPVQVPADRSSNLEAVTCGSETYCLAVGYTWPESGAGAAKALVERGLSGNWTTSTIPLPGGAVSSFLYDVSCFSSSACFAVGAYNDSAGTFHGFVERWDGSSWTQSSISPPSGQSYVLKGVDCTSSTACTAVGSATTQAVGTVKAIASLWNGSSWSTATLPLPEGDPEASLSSVDCFSSSRCVAVGDAGDGTSSRPMAMAWTAGTWTVEATLSAPAGANSSLESVSCPSAGDCVAVGMSQTPGRSAEPLMLQTEGEAFEESTDPVQGPGEPPPALTAEQAEDALEVMEEDPSFQAAVGASEFEYEVAPWTEVNEEDEETLVGAYVEVTLKDPLEWEERDWPMTDYDLTRNGYEEGEHLEIEMEASATDIEMLTVGLDLVFDAGSNVIEGEAVEVTPLAFDSGDVEVAGPPGEVDPQITGY